MLAAGLNVMLWVVGYIGLRRTRHRLRVDIVKILAGCWASVADGGPTLNQYRVI